MKRSQWDLKILIPPQEIGKGIFIILIEESITCSHVACPPVHLSACHLSASATIFLMTF